jgi:transketolase
MKEKYPLHESMRGFFGFELWKAMKDDPSIILLTGDLGYGMLDEHQKIEGQFYNCGAAETTMMGIAAGLAQEGKRPFAYTISSFYLRAAEPIALYIAREKLPVVMIGAGRDGDYAHDGPSHNGTNAQEYMRMLGIKSFYPQDKNEIEDLMIKLRNTKEPCFVSLRR